MKFISLFSGIGGFDLAFERAGMECVAVCEIDKNAQSVLRRHFPKAELFDDVRKVGKETHERKSIDVICGGFPCQDVSVAGKRAGIAGERSGLWFEFARIIDELEPRWVVVENVPGLLSSNNGKDFAVIVQWLAQRGYGVTWRVLDAQYFGVPQRRRRVFIVGSFGNGSAAEVLFESESGAGNTPPSREAGQVASTLFASGTGTSRPAGTASETGFLVAIQQNTRDEVRLINGDGQIAGALAAQAGMKQQNYIAFMAGQGEKAGGIGASETLSPTLKGAGSGTNQVPTIAIIEQNNFVSTPDMISLRANPAQPLIAQPLRAGRQYSDMGDGQTNVFPVGAGVRRLTPTECERLQGFPDGWTDGQSDSARYRQLGNAVAVPVVEWIAKRIVKAEARTTQREPDGGKSAKK